MPLPPSLSFRLLPQASAIFRQLPFRVASGPRVRYQMSGRQDGDVGEAYLAPQQAMGQIGEKIHRF